MTKLGYEPPGPFRLHRPSTWPNWFEGLIALAIPPFALAAALLMLNGLGFDIF